MEYTTGFGNTRSEEGSEEVSSVYNLGNAFNTSVMLTSLVLACIAIPLNLGVVRYHWGNLKNMVSFIYLALGLSDFCTGAV